MSSRLDDSIVRRFKKALKSDMTWILLTSQTSVANELDGIGFTCVNCKSSIVPLCQQLRTRMRGRNICIAIDDGNMRLRNIIDSNRAAAIISDVADEIVLLPSSSLLKITNSRGAKRVLKLADRWVPSDLRSIRGGYCSFADLPDTKTRWLWPKVIPLSNVTVLAGPPERGKSWFMLNVAARLSTGSTFLGQKSTRRLPECSIYASREDDDATTLKPRLTGLGANCEYIYIPEDRFSYPDNIDVLRDIIVDIRRYTGPLSLVVLDSLKDFIDRSYDPNSETVRLALQSLVGLAQDKKVAIVGILHTVKSANRSNAARIEHVSGSQAWSAIPRIVLEAKECRAAPGATTIVMTKNNLSREKKEPMTFKVDGQGKHHELVLVKNPKVRSPGTKSGDSGMAKANGRMASKDVKAWIHGQFSGLEIDEDGLSWIPSTQFSNNAKQAGISMKRVSKIGKAVGVDRRQRGRQWWRVMPIE